MAACNCRDDENIFLYPHRKTFLSTKYFPQARTVTNVYTIELL
jgi:hypothetical protein